MSYNPCAGKRPFQLCTRSKLEAFFISSKILNRPNIQLLRGIVKDECRRLLDLFNESEVIMGLDCIEQSVIIMHITISSYVTGEN